MESDLLVAQVEAANRAVVALDEHLRVLLGVADLLRVMGNEVASRELQRALMRALHVLRVLRDELVCLEVVASYVEKLPS